MPKRNSERGQPYSQAFVLSVWLIMTLIDFWFVKVYGNRTPRWEDWFFVPYLSGHQQPSLGWLWESVSGYRVPILKSLFYFTYKLFGFNSKPILFLNASMLSLLSLGLLWAAKKSRGYFRYSDAFFPIVLLNLGHVEAFSWAQTFVYVTSTTLMGVILIIVVTLPDPLRPSGPLIAGVCIVLLPLIFGGALSTPHPC
jgi:hypothetical protein